VLVVADDDDDPRRTTRIEGGRRRPTHELVLLVGGETSRICGSNREECVDSHRLEGPHIYCGDRNVQ